MEVDEVEACLGERSRCRTHKHVKGRKGMSRRDRHWKGSLNPDFEVSGKPG